MKDTRTALLFVAAAFLATAFSAPQSLGAFFPAALSHIFTPKATPATVNRPIVQSPNRPIQQAFLTGVVMGPQRQPLANVSVRATQNRNLVGAATTNAEGGYRLSVEAGTYDLEFSLAGYETRRVVGAVLDKGEISLNQQLNATLTGEEVVTLNWSTALHASPTYTPSKATLLDAMTSGLLKHSADTVPSGRDKARLTGRVVDLRTGDELIGASVKFLRDKEFVRGIVTDVEGRFNVYLEPGTYDVEVGYTGYTTAQVSKVEVQAGKLNTLNVPLAGGSDLSETVVVGYGAAKKERTSAVKAADKSVKKTKAKAPTSAPAPVTAAPAGSVAPAGGEDAILRKAESGSVSKPLEPVKSAPPPAPDYDFDMGVSMSATGRIGEKMPTRETPFVHDLNPDVRYDAHETTPKPRAGLLTAGEWNDLDNWAKHWTDLLSDGEIDGHQKTYQFFPRHRYTVLLQNEQGVPLVDVPVQLLEGQKVVWEARTDNTGKAELWYALFTATATATELQLQATIDGQNRALGAAQPYATALNRFAVRRDCTAPKNVDIVWAVDATGSMGDEINYLKTELLDVIGRVKNAHPDLNVRMGSVFYRDRDDDYLTKSSGLSSDISRTVEYIRQQSAGGGGDYPEAVHSALDAAIYDQKWSSDAVARICFLVLDASPHQDKDVVASLQRSIQEAARRGIRVVPVSASGVQKDTEFLMKFFGLATNGSYVFLTNHSGIGDKHLEPTTDEYKVEAFNDLLVRLINQYVTVATCEGKSVVHFEPSQPTDPQQPATTPAPVYFYPNPATTQFTLELPADAQKVTIYDSEGQSVRSLTTLTAGVHTVPTTDLPPGFYTLRIWIGNQVQSGKLVVVKV